MTVKHNFLSMLEPLLLIEVAYLASFTHHVIQWENKMEKINGDLATETLDFLGVFALQYPKSTCIETRVAQI